MASMNYIERTREALIAELGGLAAVKGWGVNAEQLLDAYTQLALTTGTETTAANVHDAWAVVTARTRPAHVLLVPFEDLDADMQARDDEFRDAVITAAGEVT